MKGYTYTITPDNKPLFILYSWQTDNDGAVHYTVDNLVPELDKENNGYSAVVVYYPSINMYVPLLKVQGFLIDAYLSSGFLKKEDVVYIPFNAQLLDYIKSTIKPVGECDRGRAVDAGELYPDYSDALGNKYEAVQEQIMQPTNNKVEACDNTGHGSVCAYDTEPEAVEFGGSYTIRFSERNNGDIHQSIVVHPEDNLTGAAYRQQTEVYDNSDRNKPIGIIPLEYQYESRDDGLKVEMLGQIGGQIPMVYPPTGKGKVQASVQVADVRSLIPMNMPV